MRWLSQLANYAVLVIQNKYNHFLVYCVLFYYFFCVVIRTRTWTHTLWECCDNLYTITTFLRRTVDSNHAQLNGFLFSKQAGTPFPSLILHCSLLGIRTQTLSAVTIGANPLHQETNRWLVGIEPTAQGTTILCSSYWAIVTVAPVGLEPTLSCM